MSKRVFECNYRYDGLYRIEFTDASLPAMSRSVEDNRNGCEWFLHEVIGSGLWRELPSEATDERVEEACSRVKAYRASVATQRGRDTYHNTPHNLMADLSTITDAYFAADVSLLRQSLAESQEREKTERALRGEAVRMNNEQLAQIVSLRRQLLDAGYAETHAGVAKSFVDALERALRQWRSYYESFGAPRSHGVDENGDQIPVPAEDYDLSTAKHAEGDLYRECVSELRFAQSSQKHDKLAESEAEAKRLRERVAELEVYEDEIYCNTCGSCGIEGCCDPSGCVRVKCKYPHNLKTWDDLMKEQESMIAELRRQSQAAWMRGDYVTADRIAKLLDVKSPIEHELEDLK